MKKRMRLTPEQAIAKGFKVKKNDKGRPTARYMVEVAEKKENPFVLSAWNKKGYMMSIDEYCTHYSLPRKSIKSYKLVSHTGTPFYNILFKESKEVADVITNDLLVQVVKKHIQRIPIDTQNQPKNNEYVDRIVITDVHIGMTPNENGYALYGGEWNETVLMKRLDEVVDVVIGKQQGNDLIIDDLSDYLDGWDGQTTRKGHALPQNMDNEKAFDVAVEFKVKLIDKLIGLYDSITMNNICEDNHAGSFGYVVNSAVKMILEQKYANVEVVNHRKFINHYIIGKHAFVITHGKDSKNLKFGFKPQLDPKQMEKIDQYLKINNVYKKAEFIEFSKGDSHQCMFDYATFDDFDYCNYPAFSPSSGWVQTNFKKGRSGFVFQNVNLNENEKIQSINWF